MSAPKPTKAAMQTEIRVQQAVMQEQELTIDRLRTENMDLKMRLAQQRSMARALKKQREA